MDKITPFISIVIPCRNEEKSIARCLDSIIANDYPKDSFEVLTVDGMSEDNTREVLKEYSLKYPFVKVLENPKKVTPVAMNIGIKQSKGEVVVIVNAHSVLDKDFLKLSIEYLRQTGADAVGGLLNAVNDSPSLISQSISLAVDSLFATGGRTYRNRKEEGFIRDTLPYCAYPKEIFQKYGNIDEEFIRVQDAEFNHRILKQGGRIFFSPKIKSFLYTRASLRNFLRQSFQISYFRPLIAEKIGALLTLRHLVPAVFVASLIILGTLSLFLNLVLWLLFLELFLYIVLNLAFSVSIALKKGLKYLFILPFVFFVYHLTYGLGYLKGIWDFMILKKYKRETIQDIPLTR